MQGQGFPWAVATSGGSSGGGWKGSLRVVLPLAHSCHQTFPGSPGAAAPPSQPSASAALMKIRQRSLELLSISILSIMGITKSPS